MSELEKLSAGWVVGSDFVLYISTDDLGSNPTATLWLRDHSDGYAEEQEHAAKRRGAVYVRRSWKEHEAMYPHHGRLYLVPPEGAEA